MAIPDEKTMRHFDRDRYMKQIIEQRPVWMEEDSEPPRKVTVGTMLSPDIEVFYVPTGDKIPDVFNYDIDAGECWQYVRNANGNYEKDGRNPKMRRVTGEIGVRYRDGYSPWENVYPYQSEAFEAGRGYEHCVLLSSKYISITELQDYIAEVTGRGYIKLARIAELIRSFGVQRIHDLIPINRGLLKNKIANDIISGQQSYKQRWNSCPSVYTYKRSKIVLPGDKS